MEKHYFKLIDHHFNNESFDRQRNRKKNSIAKHVQDRSDLTDNDEETASPQFNGLSG